MHHWLNKTNVNWLWLSLTMGFTLLQGMLGVKVGTFFQYQYLCLALIQSFEFEESVLFVFLSYIFIISSIHLFKFLFYTCTLYPICHNFRFLIFCTIFNIILHVNFQIKRMCFLAVVDLSSSVYTELTFKCDF